MAAGDQFDEMKGKAEEAAGSMGGEGGGNEGGQGQGGGQGGGSGGGLMDKVTEAVKGLFGRSS